jgi:hypothetical protein
VLVSLSLSGCAYVDERFHDDTGNPKFENGYHAGQTWRLRNEGAIVSLGTGAWWPPGKTVERLELWPKARIDDSSEGSDYDRVITSVAAGTLVHIDGLEHNYGVAFPPVPGDSQILRAYGTIDTATGHWMHVRIPSNQRSNWSFIPGTTVMAFPPDYDFLELSTPATFGAGLYHAR